VVVVLSLLAATAFGLGTVLQQKGTLEAGAEGGSGVRFLAGLFARPVWLLGGIVTAVGGVCQTLALRTGTLAAVQALATLSLVIALPFGGWLTDQLVTPVVWAGACATTAGVVLFVAVGSPQAGSGLPGVAAWGLAVGASAVLAVALCRAGWRRSGRPQAQALLFGGAAGLAFGLASALLKALTGRFAGGLTAVLTSWETYCLIAAGLVGLAMGQAALRTGALAPAMAATNSVTLLSCVVLGLTVFGESFAAGHLAAVVSGLALTLMGIVLLSRAPGGGQSPAAAPTGAVGRG
jgi:drug/metabolite transporter (DMT)-like permease